MAKLNDHELEAEDRKAGHCSLGIARTCAWKAKLQISCSTDACMHGRHRAAPWGTNSCSSPPRRTAAVLVSRVSALPYVTNAETTQLRSRLQLLQMRQSLTVGWQAPQAACLQRCTALQEGNAQALHQTGRCWHGTTWSKQFPLVWPHQAAWQGLAASNCAGTLRQALASMHCRAGWHVDSKASAPHPPAHLELAEL